MLKRLLKSLVPRSWREARSRRIAAAADRTFATRPPAEVFETVYRRGLWGSAPDADFYSGEGSHDESVIGPYVDAVTRFIGSLPEPPRAVDLGCGDFNVGARIREHCAAYVACDIVPSLIERNRRVFADRAVDFRALDMATEPLPDGDVVFLRQVLQHMGNAQILALLPKLRQYRFAIITEHLPGDSSFVPNLDKPPGPGIRLAKGSGVVLEAPPFDFAAKSAQELCVVRYTIGTIRTVAYRLAD